MEWLVWRFRLSSTKEKILAKLVFLFEEDRRPIAKNPNRQLKIFSSIRKNSGAYAFMLVLPIDERGECAQRCARKKFICEGARKTSHDKHSPPLALYKTDPHESGKMKTSCWLYSVYYGKCGRSKNSFFITQATNCLIQIMWSRFLRSIGLLVWLSR